LKTLRHAGTGMPLFWKREASTQKDETLGLPLCRKAGTLAP
jgi:hypothetical protein